MNDLIAPATRAAHLRRYCLLQLAAAPLLLACGGRHATDTRGAAATSLDSYPPMPAGPAPGADAEVLTLTRALGRGVNFGNMLDAPREGDWGLRASNELIDLVGGPGFVDSVRLPVRWSNHASADAAATIDPVFFERVDTVLDRLLGRGVYVVLNMHHYRQLDGDALDPHETAVDPAVLELRLLAMWRQIARRYAHRGPKLLFEIYNEPHGRLESRWNDLLSRALRVIRESNPTRPVVVGPTQWNSVNALPKLVLPADRRLILTVHHYEPFDFTHQGAEWVQPMKPLGVSCCSAAQQQLMTGLLDAAVRHAEQVRYPVFVGEFGVYSKAALADQVNYLQLMRQAMEQRALSWMVWELASGHGIYDPVAQRFRTELKAALFDAPRGP